MRWSGRWAAAAPERLPPAVIVGLGRGTLAVVRSLARRGVEVWVGAPSREPPAASRYCRGSVLLPDPLDDPGACVDALLELASGLPPRPVLLPSDDVSVGLLTRHRARFGERYRLAAPPDAMADVVLDKSRQYRRIRDAGLPIPRTWFPDGSADGGAQPDVPGDARFPLLVKPRFSEGYFLRHGRKLLVARTPLELRALLEDSPEPMLIQELMENAVEDGFQFCSFVDRGGRLLGSLTLRKRDVFPRPFGNTVAVETVSNEAVEMLAREVLDALEVRGPSEVEFIRDRRTGEYGYVELNPRFTNHTAIQVASGLDSPWLSYAEAAGLSVAPVTMDRRRLVWHCPELRIPYSRSLAPPPALPDSLPGPTHSVTDLFVPGDPGPLLRKALNAATPRARRLLATGTGAVQDSMSTLVQVRPESGIRAAVLRIAQFAGQLPAPTRHFAVARVEGTEINVTARGRAKFVMPVLIRLGGEPRRLPGPPSGPTGADVEIAWVHPWFGPAFRRRRWLLVPSHVRMVGSPDDMAAAAASPPRSLASDLRNVDRLAPELEVGEGTDDLRSFRREFYEPHVAKRLDDARPLPLTLLARRGTLLFVRSGGIRIAGALVVPRSSREVWIPRLAPLHGSDALLRAGAVAAFYRLLPAWAESHGFGRIDFGHARTFTDDAIYRYKFKWGLRPAPTRLGGYFAVRTGTPAGLEAVSKLPWPEGVVT